MNVLNVIPNFYVPINYTTPVLHFYRMARSSINRSLVADITDNDILRSSQIDSFDSCNGWSSHCFRMSFHVLRHAIPSAVFQLWRRFG